MTTEGKWNRFRNDNDLLIQLKDSKRIRLKKNETMITRESILVVSRKKKLSLPQWCSFSNGSVWFIVNKRRYTRNFWRQNLLHNCRRQNTIDSYEKAIPTLSHITCPITWEAIDEAPYINKKHEDFIFTYRKYWRTIIKKIFIKIIKISISVCYCYWVLSCLIFQSSYWFYFLYGVFLITSSETSVRVLIGQRSY